MTRRDNDFRRILVIATRQIGDVLLTTPLIHAARRRWPGAHIDLLTFAGTAGMVRGNADIDEVIEVTPRGGRRAALALLRRLWRRYDLALITDGGDRAHLYGFIAAGVRSGILPGRASTSWWKRLSVRHAVTADNARHSVVEKHALLAPWVDSGALESVVPPQALPLPEELMRRLQPRYAVVHVPSMWRYKQWPPAHYRALVQAMLADGLQVVLSGGPGRGDIEKTAEVAADLDPAAVLDLAGKLDFQLLATLLRGCVVYVGPDTSVTHLAAACGAPVVALFGPTPPPRWGPWPAAAAERPIVFAQRNSRQQVGNVVLLQGPNDCVPCGKAGCDDHHDSRSACLEALAPERVIDEVRRVLGASRVLSAGAAQPV